MSDNLFWRKLNYLFPEPQCTTRNGVITEWVDVRDQPSQTEIDAVSMQDVEASEQEEEAQKHIAKDKLTRLIFATNFDQENRLRALEGSPDITKEQYKNALIAKYKAE